MRIDSRATVPDQARLRASHDEAWRDPRQITSQWEDATRVEGRLLAGRARGSWWEVLERTGATLLVTREYEHLLMGLSLLDGRPCVTYMPLPHPSGIAVDRTEDVVYIASTRNPNQVYDLSPANGSGSRGDDRRGELECRPLIPLRSRFFPGRLYIHDLALVGGRLHANAVALNAVVRLDDDAGYEAVWWPRCVERAGEPDLSRNYLQLNSIAAGGDLASSYFSASTSAMSVRRPGHLNFPVDRRGVIFSGRSRDVVARGLTRPHSARLREGMVWVDNSGYGEVGVIAEGRFEAVARLPGWTRGLCFHRDVIFVGTSRVLPRFRHYAPGLDMDRSVCAVHALDARTAQRLGSYTWPEGNQIFAVDWLDRERSLGFPFRADRRRSSEAVGLFYSFDHR